MVWISTSGGGVGVGTSALIAGLGDTAVLEIRVSATDVNAVSVAFFHNTSVIDVFGRAAVEVCPAGLGNPFGPGACGSVQWAASGRC